MCSLFFQAEDGIRDSSVTGVQTCALFISSRRRHTRFKCDWSSDVCSSDLLEQRQHLGIGQRELAGFHDEQDQVHVADGAHHGLVERLVQRRSEEHTSELQSHLNLVCRLLLEKKKKKNNKISIYTVI